MELPDAEAALDGVVENAVAFWSAEDAVLRQLYGVAAVDQAAQDLVDRQRADRRRELERLAAGALPVAAGFGAVSTRRRRSPSCSC